MIVYYYSVLMAALFLINFGMNVQSGNAGLNFIALMLQLPLFGRVFGWW